MSSWPNDAPEFAQPKEGFGMRKSLLAAMGIMALALAVPSVALAHHGRGHHHRHHHGAHHAKFRIVHIGAGASGSAPPSTTPPAPENAGTVASYTGGVLTLTLNDGSTVSGKVTENTRIGCAPATMPPPMGPVGPADEGPGDDNGQGDDQSRGDISQGDRGWDGGSQHGDDGDDDDRGTPGPPCDSSALVAGAIVRSAELRIGSSGTEFEEILLVR
jgi:hypothetical protein